MDELESWMDDFRKAQDAYQAAVLERDDIGAKYRDADDKVKDTATAREAARRRLWDAVERAVYREKSNVV